MRELDQDMLSQWRLIGPSPPPQEGDMPGCHQLGTLRVTPGGKSVSFRMRLVEFLLSLRLEGWLVPNPPWGLRPWELKRSQALIATRLLGRYSRLFFRARWRRPCSNARLHPEKQQTEKANS